MKTRMKRLISLLCVVTVFASTVLSTNFLSAKADSGQGIALPTDMTEISFRDFELKKPGTSGVFADGEYTAWNYGEYVGETMDNTLFGGTITFPKVVDAALVYAGDAGQQGLSLTVAGDDTTGWYLRLRCSNSSLSFTEKKIYPADVNLTELVGAELELHISTKYVDHDSQGTKNDLELGLWFGDKLYTDNYIYIDNYVGAEKTGNYLHLMPKGSTITIESTALALPTDMTEITLEDFGIEDDTYAKTFSGNYAGKTMDKTLFSAKITFSDTGATDFMFGGTKAWGGFSLQPNLDTTDNTYYLRLYDTDPDKSGRKIDTKLEVEKTDLDTFVNKEFKLNYTLEYVNHDKGTTKNDLKLGVWFNEKLYDNRYIYIDNYVDTTHSIGGYITVWPREGATITVKSCNYQLPDDLTDISFRDFGIVDRENHQGWEGKQYTGETLANTLFSGTVTFPQVEGAYFNYAGANVQEGLTLWVEQDDNQEWYLRLFHKNSALLGELDQTDIYAADAGVERLVGKALELHISMEYVNLDGGTANDDLKLGLWFGDTLYQDQYIYIKNYVGESNTGTYLTYNSAKSKGGTITLKSADIKVPRGLTEISFRDFGFVDGPVSATTSTGEYDGDTLKDTVFSGKITYPIDGKSHLSYGGTRGLAGFLLSNETDLNGVHYLRLWDSNADGTGTKFPKQYQFYADKAGVNALVGEEIDLKFTMQYIDNEGDGETNDLKLGVWFGGKLYENQWIYINNYVDNGHSIGNYMSVWNQTSGKYIAVESVGEINWKSLPEGLTELSFRDFGFDDGNVTKTWTTGEYDGEDLDDTLFSGKITLPKPTAENDYGDNIFLMYGGKIANGGGFQLGTGYDTVTGKYCLRLLPQKTDINNFKEIKLFADVAETELFDTELDLKISMQYIDRDGDGTDNDVKLGVWLDGKLYSNRYIYLYDFVDNNYSMGTWMTIARTGGAATSIDSVGEINWKSLPTGLTEISFRDFGFDDGNVAKSWTTGKYDGEDLDDTLFSGKITLPKPTAENNYGDTVHLMYGGKIENGGGFELSTGYDTATGKYCLRLRPQKSDITNFTEIKLFADKADTELFETELDLKISMQYIDRDGDGTDNDVKLGVWLDGKLYSNRYVYLYDFVDNDYSMGTWMTIARLGGAVTSIESAAVVNWKDLPTGMTQITFRDFGFTDGDYTKYPSGQYDAATLDNTMFIGKITFPEVKDVFLQYGGKEAGGGFNLGTAYDEENDEWYLRLFDTKKVKGETTFKEQKFYADIAGVEDLVGKEVALVMTLQYVEHDGDGNKDDVKLGVWFNGKLYKNNYIYMDDYANTAHCMGTWMSFYCAKTTSVHVESVGEINWKPLPTGFTELGFDDFGFKAGVYEGGSKAGNCELDSMDKVLFSGIVKYTTVGETHLMFGGKSAWGGFDLVNVYDEKTGEHYLRLFDTNKDKKGKLFNDMYFYSDVAETTLVGEELDLKFSLEYVNHDGGKTNNDLKLGVWFGGKLYNNRYIYIDNYVDNSHSVGSYLTLWVRNEASFYVGRISDWLNWSAFGLTANWKKTLLDTDFNLTYTLAGGNPYTGDNAQLPYLAMFISLAVIVLYGTQVVRRGRREDDIC